MLRITVLSYAIREYAPADETAWLRCRVLSFLNTAYFDDVRRAKPVIPVPGFELVAADESGAVVGIMDVTVENELATVETVAVHPDHQHRGIGRALLAEARSRVDALDVPTLDAWTRDDPDTLRWYRAMGFAESEHYLHVYANYYAETGEPDRAIAERRPGLRPMQAFLHANLQDELLLREQFTRVHVCRRFVLNSASRPGDRHTPCDAARRRTTEDPMTTTPAGNGKPPVVDPATWQAARDELLVREKAHTREGDAIAAARRRLPMVEFDGAIEVVGLDGRPLPFRDLFRGRDELVVYKHMWYDGAPHQGQCEGCTTTAWHMRDAAYLTARGVSYAVLTTGPWDEVARFVEFMGYTEPWYSVRDAAAPVGDGMGSVTCYLRDGDRVFLTYSTTGRGNEPVNGSLGLLDMTPYGRREGWQDDPEGWPEAPEAGAPTGGHGAPICWYWRTDADGVATWGPTGRPVPQWTRPGAVPEQTLGRQGPHS